MAIFLIRVELHGVKHGDESYNTLHKAMEKAGFTRTITGDDGARFHLPTAEYFCQGDYRAELVRDTAQKAADTTGKTNAIIVADAKIVAYTGLKSA